MQRVLGIVTGLTAIAAASMANAAPVLIQPNEAASNDTFVYSFLPTTPFGNTTYMGVSDATIAGQAHDTRSLISFDLTGVTLDSGEVARIGFWVRSKTGTAFDNPFIADPSPTATVPVNAYEITSSWIESSTNWNSQPSVAASSFASTTVSGINQFYSFDATTLVSNWLANPGSNFGVELRMDAPVQNAGIDVAVVIDSAGGSGGAPYLQIMAVPEPTTLGVLFVAGALGVRRRRV